MASLKRTSVWAGVALGSFSVIAAIAGSNLKGLLWLLHLCGFILTASVLILIWDRFIGSALRSYFNNHKEKVRRRESFPDYYYIIKKFRVLEELDKALSLEKVDWGNRRPQLHGSVQNALSNIEYGLNGIPSEYRLIASNVLLREIVGPFDSWLNACDILLKNGQATYKTENARNEVLFQIRRYSECVEKHDEICRIINDKLISTGAPLAGLYCQPHGFNWKNAEPKFQKPTTQSDNN